MRASIAPLAFLLAGCAGASPSQSMMISEDTALISVSGTLGDAKSLLIDASLREAANISKAHGYPYFVILGAADTTRSFKHTVMGDTLSNQNIPGDSTSFASTNLSSSYIPGATYTTPDRLVKEMVPGLDVTVRMYRKGGIDPTMDGVWASEAVLSKSATLP